MFKFLLSSDFKNRKIQRSLDLEPQEILLDKLAQKQAEKLGVSERKFEVPLSKNVLKFLYLISLVLISLLFYRTFQLQFFEGKHFTALAEGNKFIIYQIKAFRGVIYDKNFEQLVLNKPSFDLIYRRQKLPEDKSEAERILREIAFILKEDYEILKRTLEESEESTVLISKNLSHQKLIILETRIKEFPGFEIENNAIREYKEGPNFAHLIGYLGKISAQELKENSEIYSITDFIGKVGLEKYYEVILRKNPGKLRVERDALGNPISKEIIQFPEPGENLVLFIDASLQRKIKTELEKKLKEIGLNKAVAIAIDPKTGGVLALVNYPSFDNNLFSQGISQEEWQKLDKDPNKPLFNRAIAGRYLTGSTIKPLIALAALEEGIISPFKKINCQGEIIIEDAWDPEKVWEYGDWMTHGWTDMKKAIAESCNVYFYTIGGGYDSQEGLGPTRIKKYLELFGWNQKTQIDLPGESSGFIPDKEWKKEILDEGWWDGDTYNMAIGQGYLKITPLEVAVSFLPIANGGNIFKPMVVQKIIDSEKNTIKEFQPEILRENFIDSRNLQIVREGMRQAVTGVNSPHASASSLNSLPVSSAAKTGTAETDKKIMGERLYHNWITVFAPYESPEILLTIVVEEVRGMQPAAVPVAKEVLEWYFGER